MRTTIHTFEPEGSGTKWTMEIRPAAYWRLPPLTWLLGWGYGKMGEMFVSRLKAALEKPAPRRTAAAAHE